MTLQVACSQFIESSDVTCDCDELDPQTISDLIDQASDALAIMSYGNVTGRCSEVRRPRGPGGCVCRCADLVTCGCPPLHGIPLPGPDPVVSNVMIDGEAFTDFVVVDGRTLLRTDGGSWPGCQDITLADNAVGAFAFTVAFGFEPQELAKRAAAEIVCSLVADPPQEPRRRLPNQTRAVSFAGVSVEMETLVEELKARTFLMPNVARFYSLYAGTGAVVYSPELEDGWILHSRS